MATKFTTYPWQRLPLEIRVQIFEYLTMGVKTKCLQVSKSWHAHLTDPVYWTSLTITILHYHGRGRAIQICKPLEYAQERLKRIYIKQKISHSHQLLRSMQAGPAGHSLKSLSLIRVPNDNWRKNGMIGSLRGFGFDFCANTLEHLDIRSWSSIELPEEFPILKTLRIEYGNVEEEAHCPQLKALHLYSMHIYKRSRPLIAPHISTMQLGYLSYRTYGQGEECLQPIYDMQVERLEHLDLHVHHDSDNYGPPNWRDDGLQTEGIVKMLHMLGHDLKSFTLRKAYLNATVLEAVFRLCPLLDGFNLIDGEPQDRSKNPTFSLRKFLLDPNNMGDGTWELVDWRVGGKWHPSLHRTQACRLHRLGRSGATYLVDLEPSEDEVQRRAEAERYAYD